MGAIRSVPNIKVQSKAQQLKEFSYVEASICGWQHIMEDYTGFAQIDDKVSVFFVIDGHGGPDLAELATEEIPKLLESSEAIKSKQYQAALESLFQSLDQSLRSKAKEASVIRERQGLPPVFEKFPTSGFSIVLALFSQSQITIANVGECKCYVTFCSNASKAVLKSGNHTETSQQDESRVKNAGGFFLNGKVNGMFPYTRSIGDYAFKSNQSLNKDQQLLVATPSIFSLRKQDIKSIMLGSNGLWENPNQVLKVMAQKYAQPQDLIARTEKLLVDLLNKNPSESEYGLKNMSIIMIDLRH